MTHETLRDFGSGASLLSRLSALPPTCSVLDLSNNGLLRLPRPRSGVTANVADGNQDGSGAGSARTNVFPLQVTELFLGNNRLVVLDGIRELFGTSVRRLDLGFNSVHSLGNGLQGLS